MSYVDLLQAASPTQLAAIAASKPNTLFTGSEQIGVILSRSENRRRLKRNADIWENQRLPQLTAQIMLHLARRYGGDVNEYFALAKEKAIANAKEDYNSLEYRFQGGYFGIPIPMGQAIQNGDHSPPWLDSENLMAINGKFYHADACWTCDNCDNTYLTAAEESCSVHTSTRSHGVTEEWCEECVRDSSFYCDISDERYADGTFDSVDVYHGHTGCEQYVRRNGYEFSDFTNSWVSPDDWEDAHEDEENRSGNIPEYHNAARRFRSDRFPFFHTPLDRTYGIELEVKFPNSSSRQAFFDDNFRNDGSNTTTDFSAELDGSLCDYTGLEIIGPPIPLREYYDPNGRWKAMCEELLCANAEGWPHRAAYGMHVNVDWRSENDPSYYGASFFHQQQWTTAIERFEAFMLNNRPLCSFVAGRNFVYGTHPEDGGGYRKVASIREMNDNANGTKYNLVRRRDDLPLVEVRIFGSNIRHEGIVRNIEFVDSLRRYTMLPDANLFAGAGSAAYRQWLLQPMNAARWSYIAAFLTPIPTINSKNPNVANFAKSQRLAVA